MAKLDVFKEVAKDLQECVLRMVMLCFDEISFLVLVEWNIALLAEIDHSHQGLVSNLSLHGVGRHPNRLLRLRILVALERTERLQEDV